jgi:hypothetical protein
LLDSLLSVLHYKFVFPELQLARTRPGASKLRTRLALSALLAHVLVVRVGVLAQATEIERAMHRYVIEMLAGAFVFLALDLALLRV